VERGQSVFALNDSNLDGFFNAYPTYEQTVGFLATLSSTYPGHVRVAPIGTSVEARQIQAVHLSTNYSESQRPTLMIIGGQHAREWVSTTSAFYVAYQLAKRYQDADPAVVRLLTMFDIRVIPLVNPDGYVYSYEHDRMWRKTRQVLQVDGEVCTGIDTNRNFATAWSKSASGVNTECPDDFPGTEPFQSPEALAVAEYVKTIPYPLAFLDLHSYAQYWMYPYAAYCDEPPAHYEDLMEAALGAAAAGRNRADGQGVRYDVGLACDLLVRATGSALDWMYIDRGVKYSYYVQLRDSGAYGFLLPATQIRPTGEDVVSGVVFLGEFIRERERLD